LGTVLLEDYNITSLKKYKNKNIILLQASVMDNLGGLVNLTEIVIMNKNVNFNIQMIT